MRASGFLSTPSARRATLVFLHVHADGENFYPRPPRGGRPTGKSYSVLNREISIHALREEGDQALTRSGIEEQNFYPRPPRGGRPSDEQASTRTLQFLSTPSARRATTKKPATSAKQRNFYPRPPRGGRPGTTDKPAPYEDFYPRPPRGGRQDAKYYIDIAFKFLSTPSARRAT